MKMLRQLIVLSSLIHLYFSCQTINSQLYYYQPRLYQNRTMFVSFFITKEQNTFLFQLQNTKSIEIYVNSTERFQYNVENITVIVLKQDSRYIGLEKSVTIYYPIEQLNFLYNETHNVSFNNVTTKIIPVQSLNCNVRPIMRIAQIHISMYIIEILFFCIMFCLCILLMNKQPMKSRGVLPIVACFCQICMLLSDLFVLIVDYEFNEKYGCFFYRYIYIVFLNVNMFLIPIQMFRYLLISTVNDKKKILSKKIVDGEDCYSMSYLFFILKIMIKPLFSVFIIFLTIVVTCTISTIIFASNNFQCDNSEDIFGHISVYLISAIGILLFIVIWVNKIVKKKWDIYDRFYYEIELCLFLPLIICTTILINILLYTIQYNVYMYVVLNTVNIWLFFIYQVGFVFVLTLCQLFKKKTNSNVLEEIFKDKIKYDMFYIFTEKEFSIENILSYNDICKYKTIVDEEEKLHIAKNIYNLYFNGNNSNMEVNVARSLTLEIKNKINNNQLSIDLFSGVEKTIMTNLSDTYSRFSYSKEYVEHMKSIEIIQNVLENN
jgi:hypothetical protein